MSKIEDAVAERLLLRAKIGKEKYGTTMERDDLSLFQWLNHLQEELLDACVYVEKLKEEFRDQTEDALLDRYDRETVLDKYHDDMERRMDIIGQNGNDGLHYANVDGYFTTNSLNINGAEVTYRSPCSNHAYESDQEK